MGGSHSRTYAGAVRLGALLLRALDLRVDLRGAEHVPAAGPVVLAANHVSFLDFLLVGLAARPAGRQVRFLARHEVWRPPLLGPVLGRAMDAMGHVPVDRAAPAAAYLQARRRLLAGEAVGVFPEAGVSRSFTVRGLMPGAVALSRETGAPLVPVAIWGPQRVLTAGRGRDLTRGRPVSLLVGPPLEVGAGSAADGLHRLGSTLQGMLEGLQRRPGHRPEPRPGERVWWHPAHLGGGAPTAAEAEDAAGLPAWAAPVTWGPAAGVPRGPRAD